jgi:ATP-dependent DNA ligase
MNRFTSAPTLLDLAPMQAARKSPPFTDAAWAFQLCPAGGQRLLVEVGAERGVCLHSASHVDVTAWFPEVVESLSGWDGGRTVLDAELCVLDAAGRNDPERLRQRCLVRGPVRGPVRGHPAGLDEATLVLRDVLVHDDRDVRAWGWSRRQRLLRSLDLAHPRLRKANGVEGEGEWLYRQAEALGQADVFATLCEGPYQGGRSPACLLIPSATALR